MIAEDTTGTEEEKVVIKVVQLVDEPTTSNDESAKTQPPAVGTIISIDGDTVQKTVHNKSL